MTRKYAEFLDALQDLRSIPYGDPERDEFIREHFVDRVLTGDYPDITPDYNTSTTLAITPDDIDVHPEYFDISVSKFIETANEGGVITLEAHYGDTFPLDHDAQRPQQPGDFVDCIVAYTLAARVERLDERVEADIHVFPGDVDEYKDAITPPYPDEGPYDSRP